MRLLRLSVCAMVLAATPGFAEDSPDWKRCADVNNKEVTTQALAACDRLFKDPGEAKNQAMILRNKCGIRYTAGDFDMALSDCNQAMRMEPKSPIVHNRRGLIWYKKGDMDRAFSDYNKAIELNPKYPIALNNRALVFHLRKDYDRALRDFNEAVQYDPNYARAIFNRGLTHKAMGNTAGAEADFVKARQLDPKVD
jgi:Flp pilus assembly protein TadD